MRDKGRPRELYRKWFIWAVTLSGNALEPLRWVAATPEPQTAGREL